MAHIQIDDRTPRVYYTVGGTPETVFEVPFAFFDDSDLDVYVDGVLQTISINYTVTGAGLSAGGTVVFVVAKSSTDIAIIRNLEIARVTDFPASGPFDINALNTELDRIVAMEQESRSIFDRSVSLPETEAGIDLELPPAADRANTAITFDADGNMSLLPVVAGALQPGAANILYTPPWANSLPRSVASVLEERLSIFEFIPSAQWAAILNYTSTYDCADNINSAVTAADGRPVFFPPGLYCVGSAVRRVTDPARTFTPGMKIHGSGMALNDLNKGTVFKKLTNSINIFEVSTNVVSHYTNDSEFQNFSATVGAGITGGSVIVAVAAWHINIKRVAVYGAFSHGIQCPLVPALDPVLSDSYQCYAMTASEMLISGTTGWGVEFNQGQSPGLFHLHRIFIVGCAGGGIYTTTGQSKIEQCNIQICGTAGSGTAGIRVDTSEGPSMALTIEDCEVQENYDFNFYFTRAHLVRMRGNRSIGHLYSNNTNAGTRWAGSTAPVPAGYVPRPLTHFQLGGADALAEMNNFVIDQTVVRTWESTTTPHSIFVFGGSGAANFGRITNTEWQINRDTVPWNNVTKYNLGVEQQVYIEDIALATDKPLIYNSPVIKPTAHVSAVVGQTIFTSQTVMLYATVGLDTHTAWSVAAGTFTVPYTGEYEFCGSLALAAGAFEMTVDLYNVTIAGTLLTKGFYCAGPAATFNATYEFSAYLTRGHVIQIRATKVGANGTTTADATRNYLRIRATH